MIDEDDCSKSTVRATQVIQDISALIQPFWPFAVVAIASNTIDTEKRRSLITSPVLESSGDGSIVENVLLTVRDNCEKIVSS